MQPFSAGPGTRSSSRTRPERSPSRRSAGSPILFDSRTAGSGRSVPGSLAPPIGSSRAGALPLEIDTFPPPKRRRSRNSADAGCRQNHICCPSRPPGLASPGSINCEPPRPACSRCCGAVRLNGAPGLTAETSREIECSVAVTRHCYLRPPLLQSRTKSDNRTTRVGRGFVVRPWYGEPEIGNRFRFRAS